MGAKPANLFSGMVNAPDQQAASSKVAKDASRVADLLQKSVDGGSTDPQANADLPQKFELALSQATAAQNPDAKAPASKTKAISADASAQDKAHPAASPDIALLMSLLPALPPSDAAQAASAPAPAVTQDDALAVTAVSSDAGGRATSTPNTPATSATSALPQALPADAANAPASSPAVVAAAASASSDAAPAGGLRSTDKSDLFASVLANLETPAPAPTSVPMLAVPTHQAATLTAVAQALPVTAPGSLDELPISHNDWPAAMGHRLLWAVGEGMQKAEISVSPQDMGPISVHIRVENDKADIRFTAAHAHTREVLESSMPRLRDMFSQQGLNLSQAQVFSQHSHDTPGRQPEAHTASSSASSSNADETQEMERPRPMQWRRGLVDDYA